MAPVVAAGAALWAGITATVSSITIGQIALTIGASLLSPVLTMLTRKKPSVPKAEDGKINLRQATPPLRRGYGEIITGGDYNFYRSRNHFARQGLVFGLGPIDAFIAFKLHDEWTEIDGSGYVTDPGHFSWEGRSRVRIETRLGLVDDPTYDGLIDHYPDIWSAAHTLPGLANALVSCESVGQSAVADVYEQGLPQPLARIRQALVWDPRDPAQDPDDASTWAYSASPALAWLDYARHWTGYRLTLDNLAPEDFSAAADVDDGLELGFDGLMHPRWRLGGRYDVDLDRKVTASAIAQTGDIWIYVRSDGRIGCKPGSWQDPTVTITDRDLIALSIASPDASDDRVTVLGCEYSSLAHGYVTTDAAPWPPGSAPVADGQATDKKTLPWCTEYRQARQLQKIDWGRRNADRGTAIVSGRRIDIEEERRIRLHIPRRGLVNIAVEITAGPEENERGQLVFSWREDRPEWHTLSPTEEGPAPPVIDADEDDGLSPVSGFDVTVVAEVLSGGRLSAYALCTWDAPAADSIAHRIDYQSWDGITAGANREIVVQAGESAARTAALPDGGTYRFRIRPVDSGGSDGPVSDWLYRTVTVDAAGPPAGEILSATGGAGSATITFLFPNAENVNAITIYRAPTGDPLASATPVLDVLGAPSLSGSATDSPVAAGGWDYWIVSVNASGVPGGAAGPASVTVT